MKTKKEIEEKKECCECYPEDYKNVGKGETLPLCEKHWQEENNKETKKYINELSELDGFAELLDECDYDFHSGRNIEKLKNFIKKAIQQAKKEDKNKKT